ncbi:hypothetical protein ACLB2K_040457 [Fragaria x ananassa]
MLLHLLPSFPFPERRQHLGSEKRMRVWSEGIWGPVRTKRAGKEEEGSEGIWGPVRRKRAGSEGRDLGISFNVRD